MGNVWVSLKIKNASNEVEEWLNECSRVILDEVDRVLEDLKCQGFSVYGKGED